MNKQPTFVETGIHRAFITLTAVLCIALSVMNISIADAAFSEIKANLACPLEQVLWITTIYSLGYIMIMPLSNSLNRWLGQKNALLLTLILFTFSSFCCGRAAGLGELIVFRFLQGLGGGAMLILSHIIITECWPVANRAISQVFVLVGMMLGTALAQPVGGYITDDFSWPYIFYANLPVGMIAGILVLVFVKNRSSKRKEDWLSNAMLAIAVASFYLVVDKRSNGYFSYTPFIVILPLLSFVAVILFAWKRFNFSSQAANMGLLQNANLRVGLILVFVTAIGLVGSSIVKSDNPGNVISLPLILMVSIITLITTAILIQKTKAFRYTVTIGLLLLLACCYLAYSPGLVSLSVFLTIRSVAASMLSVSITTMVLSTLESEQVGEGIVWYNIVRQLGGAIGMVLLTF